MKTFLVLIGLMILGNAHAIAGNIYIYYHVSNKENLDLVKAKRIFQGDKLTWENGLNIIILLDQIDIISDTEFKEFSQLNKAEFLDLWRVKFFSGRALAPIQIRNKSKAFEALIENPTSLFFSFKKIEIADPILEKVLVY